MAPSALTNYLRERLHHSGRTLVDLEAQTGVPDSTLSRYFRGTVKRVQPVVLAHIARALELDWAHLMDLAGLTPGVSVREQSGLPSDVLALLVAEPWMMDLVRRIGKLPPSQQRAVTAYLRHLMDQAGNGLQSPGE